MAANPAIRNIQEILSDPAVRNLTKDIIRMATQKDPVDAVADIRLALDAVEKWEQESR